MKKLGYFILIFLFLIPLSLSAGCYYNETVQPKNVYKKHITLSDISTDVYDGSYTEYIANEKSGAVVTIYSEFKYRNIRGSYSSAYCWRSGIILNDCGYILTTGSAVQLRASDQSSSVQTVEASYVYVYLNPLYNDAEAYSATIIDYDADLNLALLKMYDTFYYYTDEENKTSEKGFQFTAEFYDARATLKTGDYCAFVGDLIGEGVGITTGVISDNEMTVLDGVTYNQNLYHYIQATAALNEQALGGALYDKNGYIIGIAQSKVVSDTDASTFNKVGLALPSACVVDYINAVSAEKKTVISYNITVSAGV